MKPTIPIAVAAVVLILAAAAVAFESSADDPTDAPQAFEPAELSDDTTYISMGDRCYDIVVLGSDATAAYAVGLLASYPGSALAESPASDRPVMYIVTELSALDGVPQETFINRTVADGDIFASYCAYPDFDRILGSYSYVDSCDLWAITDAAGHRSMCSFEGYSQQGTVEALLEWADRTLAPAQAED